MSAQDFVAVPVLPAVVVDLPAAIGQRLEPNAPVATIGSNQFTVQIERRRTAEVNELTPDVEIACFLGGLRGDLRTRRSASVRGAACGRGWRPSPGTGQTEQPSAEAPAQSGSQAMSVKCDPLPPADALGANLRVTMTVRRSEGPVLVVPATAITATSSGEAFVEVVGEDTEARRVAVSVGGEADSFVAVEPVDGEGSLIEGMDVRVRRG